MKKEKLLPDLSDPKCSRCGSKLLPGTLTAANLPWALRHGVYCRPCNSERKTALTAKKALDARKRKSGRAAAR